MTVHALPIAHATYLRTLDAWLDASTLVWRDEACGKAPTTLALDDRAAADRALAVARAAYLALVDELAGGGPSAVRVEVAV